MKTTKYNNVPEIHCKDVCPVLTSYDKELSKREGQIIYFCFYKPVPDSFFTEFYYMDCTEFSLN